MDTSPKLLNKKYLRSILRIVFDKLHQHFEKVCNRNDTGDAVIRFMLKNA